MIQAWWLMLVLKNLRQEDSREFKANLGNTLSSWSTCSMVWDFASRKSLPTKMRGHGFVLDHSTQHCYCYYFLEITVLGFVDFSGFFFFWLLWFEAKVSFSVLEYYCRCINGRTPQFIYFKISQFGEALFYMPTCTGIILGWKNCYLLFLFLGALFFFLAVFKVEPRTQSSSSSFSCVLILNWGLPRWNSLGSPGCAVYFV